MSRISFSSRNSVSRFSSLSQAAAIALLVMSAGLASAQNSGGAPKDQDTPKTNMPRGERPPGGGGGGGGGGQRALSPEKQQAAWEAQAKSVAKRVGASDAEATKVAAAYVESRKSQIEATQKAREEFVNRARQETKDGQPEGNPGGSRPRGGQMAQEVQKALDETNSKEREKLSKALSGIFTPGQAEKAIVSLGTYNRQWDLMADQIAGMSLEAGKHQTAMDAIETFIVAQDASRPRGGEADDRDAAREKMRETREKLTESLKGVLTEEQLKEFETATRPPAGRNRQNPQGGPVQGQGDDKGNKNKKNDNKKDNKKDNDDPMDDDK